MSENNTERVELTELEKIKKENDELKAKLMTPSTEKPKKERKPFEWTPKRLEAFQKMREGLDSKNELTKKMKEEKSKSEKEDIKKRVREIMNFEAKAKEVKQEESEASTDEESSEEEKPKKKKSSKPPKKKLVEKEKKRRAKEVTPEPSTDEEDSEESEESEEEKVVMSVKKQQKARDSKAKTGKWQKQTPIYNPNDRFILL